jgi:hypothetical protein
MNQKRKLTVKERLVKLLSFLCVILFILNELGTRAMHGFVSKNDRRKKRDKIHLIRLNYHPNDNYRS